MLPGLAAAPAFQQTDPNFSSVCMLLPGSALVDRSRYARALSVDAGVTVAPAVSKFGGGSYRFDGGGITWSPGTEFNIGSGDFTMEAWFYYSNAAANMTLFSMNRNTTYPALSQYDNILQLTDKTISPYYVTTGALSWPAKWYHIVFMRRAGVLTCYRDGQLMVSWNYGATINQSGKWIALGRLSSGFFFNGWVEQFRVSNIARYAGPFTPPAEPFPLE